MSLTMSGQTAAKIVDPNTVYTDQNKKAKANLNSFQVAVIAQAEALELCLCNPMINVVQTLTDEMRQHSRSLTLSRISMRGAANELYKEVGTARVAAEDKKRSMQLENNTI